MLYRKILDNLIDWANDPSRKPLLVRGARQVGKTSIVRELGRLHFKNFFELNLEDRAIARNLREPLSIEQFVDVLKISYGIDLEKKSSLLFIDEVQEVPWILELFRFFYERYPEVAVIASGSLLEVKLKELNISTPVGRLENIFMYPLTFYEFLKALQEDELIEYINKVTFLTSIPEAIHQKALNLFYNYSIIGGMPEVVNQYVKTKDDFKISKIKSNLLITYLDAVIKYTLPKKEKYIQHVLEHAPDFAGCKFSYAKFASSKYGSAQMKGAFDLLSNALLVYLIEPTDKAEIPLTPQAKRQKKLIYLDVGLVAMRFGLGLNSPKFFDLSDAFRGQIAEQVVGQQIISSATDVKSKFFYWSKISTQGEAEVDFLLQKQSQLIALEVKSGASGRLKSLLSIANSFPDTILMRIYSGSLKIDNLNGKKIYSLPFYMINRLFDLAGSFR